MVKFHLYKECLKHEEVALISNWHHNTTDNNEQQQPPITTVAVDTDTMIDNALVQSSYIITKTRVRALEDGGFDRTIFCTVNLSEDQKKDVQFNVHFPKSGSQHGGSLWYEGGVSKHKVPYNVVTLTLAPTEDEKAQANKDRQEHLDKSRDH